MAKMKTFAVEVEITLRRTVFVDARKPNGAIKRVMTREGWAEATRYSDDPVLDSIIDPSRKSAWEKVAVIEARSD